MKFKTHVCEVLYDYAAMSMSLSTLIYLSFKRDVTTELKISTKGGRLGQLENHKYIWWLYYTGPKIDDEPVPP